MAKITIPKERIDYVHSLPLRKYQREGFEFIYRRRRIILGDDMGLGKTLQLLGAAYVIDPEDILIICSKSALSVWRSEITQWFPEWKDSVILIEGQAYQRQKAWKEYQRVNSGKHIAVCTYQSYMQDYKKGIAPRHSSLVILDEAHKIKNRKTLLFQLIDHISYDRIYLSTGSPSSKGPPDLWTLCYICDPNTFPSYWKFVNTFCIFEDGFFGKEYVGVKNSEKFRELTKNFFIRRSKKDPEIAKELPVKIRGFLEATMTNKQVQMYNKLADEMMLTIEGAEGNKHLMVSTVLALMTKLRQFTICPKLLDPSLDYGEGIKTIIQHFKDEELEKAVIFCIYPSCFKYLQEYIESCGIAVNCLRGGMSADEVDNVVKWFSGPDERIVLCSVLFAESFSLVQAHTGYVLGPSYNPMQNKQAEDRIHRLSSTEPVNIFYVRIRDTVEDSVFEILDRKSVDITHILSSPEEAAALINAKRPKHS